VFNAAAESAFQYSEICSEMAGYQGQIHRANLEAVTQNCQ
jgi:hypothetical protein